MSSTFRALVTGGLMGVLAMIAMSTLVQAESPAERQVNLRKAARAALYGPDAKLKVGAHDFVIKHAGFSEKDGVATIYGQISHQLSLRPDDQLYYTIRKLNGKVLSVDIRVSRGGLAPVVAAAGNYVGLKYAEPLIDGALSKLGQTWDGDWESMAKLAVASIALRAPDSHAALRQGAGAYKPKSSK